MGCGGGILVPGYPGTPGTRCLPGTRYLGTYGWESSSTGKSRHTRGTVTGLFGLPHTTPQEFTQKFLRVPGYPSIQAGITRILPGYTGTRGHHTRVCTGAQNWQKAFSDPLPNFLPVLAQMLCRGKFAFPNPVQSPKPLLKA
eukprot:819265-Rhodomonas_salina.1